MNQTEKKLRYRGLGASIDGGEIVVESTRKVSIDMKDEDSDTDYDLCEEMAELVIECLSTDKHPWGGFRTAGGFWYLEKNYDPCPMQAALRDQLGVAYYD